MSALALALAGDLEAVSTALASWDGCPLLGPNRNGDDPPLGGEELVGLWDLLEHDFEQITLTRFESRGRLSIELRGPADIGEERLRQVAGELVDHLVAAEAPEFDDGHLGDPTFDGGRYARTLMLPYRREYS